MVSTDAVCPVEIAIGGLIRSVPPAVGSGLMGPIVVLRASTQLHKCPIVACVEMII